MSIGPAEIIIVLILALLVFGPKRLPQMGKSLGKGVREFRKAADTAKTEFGLGEVTDQINDVKSTFTEPIKDVTGTIGDLKSSVDLKSAIEAPVAATGARRLPAASEAQPRARLRRRPVAPAPARAEGASTRAPRRRRSPADGVRRASRRRPPEEPAAGPRDPRRSRVAGDGDRRLAAPPAAGA